MAAAGSSKGMSALLANGAVQKALEAFYQHTPKSVVHFNDIIIKSGQGSWVTTTDGTKYLDMTSGIGVTSTGHCHPRVVEAVQKQAAEIVHAQQNVVGAHEPMVALVDRLLGITPSHLSRFAFFNSGAEAVENAVKVARGATGRPNIIAFDGGFHGRTFGAMALTTSKTVYRQGFAPLMPGVFISPYPYCLHCKVQDAWDHSGYHLAPYCEPFDKPSNRRCCNPAQESRDRKPHGLIRTIRGMLCMTEADLLDLYRVTAEQLSSSALLGQCNSPPQVRTADGIAVRTCGHELHCPKRVLLNNSSAVTLVGRQTVYDSKALAKSGQNALDSIFIQCIHDSVGLCAVQAWKWMMKMQTAPQETAAIILEPILGEGGFLTPPPGFMTDLRNFADKHGILIIADEVQAGVGRTGTWWGHQQFDDGAMKPDILVFAKGIASGYPLAGIATRPELFDNLAPGTIGGTYGGNAVACAAAVATIDVLQQEGILQNAKERGTQLMKGLVDMASRHPCIIDVRGRGLMVGVELGALDGSSREGVTGFASAVTKAAGKRNMLLMAAGARESIRFLPALTVSESEVTQALDIFEASLAETTAAMQH